MRDVPPITRSWVSLCILTTIAVVRTFRHPLVTACATVAHPKSPLFTPTSQQIEMVTPLQLYFSFKSTITNAQVGGFLIQPKYPADKDHSFGEP